MSHEDARQFRDAIVNVLGLNFDDAKFEMLDELLRRRVQLTGLSPQAYLRSLQSETSREELSALAEELTVGETYFFRNSAQFEALAQVVVPTRLRAPRAGRTLRILSAGCSSGEEAYSLAIVAGEALPDPSWTLSVRAIDLNPAALRRAARGRYTAWSLRETREDLQRRWFQRDGNEVVLDSRIRDAVQFDQRNLAVDDGALAPDGPYDVVFCRNVIMYFAPDVARAVIGRLERALAPGGYLFLGHAETLRGLSQTFELCHTHGTFYYKRPSEGPTERASEHRAPRAPTVEPGVDWIEAIHRASDRISALAKPPAREACPPIRDLSRTWSLLHEERFADALASLPDDSAHDPDLLLLRAVLLVHGGKIGEAELASRRLIAVDELNAGAHYVLALCRESAGDRKGAADEDQVAVYLDPTFAMPRLHLGQLARRAGDRSAARRDLAQALLLLQREDAVRVLLFGGGFPRDALIALCRAELEMAGGA